MARAPIVIRILAAVVFLYVWAATFGIATSITVEHALGLIALGLAVAIAV